MTSSADIGSEVAVFGDAGNDVALFGMKRSKASTELEPLGIGCVAMVVVVVVVVVMVVVSGWVSSLT